MRVVLLSHLPLFLSLLLYFLLYLMRVGQGGWEGELNLFEPQRQLLVEKAKLLLPSPQAELMLGILLGEKSNLPAQLRLALRDTATLHMVVVSGQNLTMLAGVVMGLAGMVHRKIALALSFLAIVFYTLLTGADIPVIRAAIMAILAFGGQFLGRQRDGMWFLLIAAAAMLLVNPNWLWQVSFQLSFLATFGVLAMAPLLKRLFNFLPRFVNEDLAVTTGAQLMVIPVIAYNFHQLSLVGLLANVMVSWTVPIIMILGSIMLILSLFVGFLAGFIAWGLEALLTYFIYTVQLLGNFSFSWVYIQGESLLAWVGYYLMLAGIFLALKRHQKQNVL